MVRPWLAKLREVERHSRIAVPIRNPANLTTKVFVGVVSRVGASCVGRPICVCAAFTNKKYIWSYSETASARVNSQIRE